MKPITIAIIEDDVKFLKEFKEVLLKTKEVEIILEFHTAEDCLSADLSNINYIFIDIGLTGMKGIELLAVLSQKYPDSSKIMVTRLTTDSNLFESLKFGAVGFIIKSDMIKIHEILPSIFRGGFYISPPIAVYLSQYFNEIKKISPKSPLTESEYKVLIKLSEGYTVDEVGKDLNISKNTVQFHIRGIYEALQVSNRVQMLKKASELKIIP